MMVKVVKIIGYFLIGIILRIKSICYLLTNSAYTSAESYFPEYAEMRKCRFRILIEQVLWSLKYGNINDFYFLYGFDIKKLRKQSDYVDYALFRKRRELLQKRANNNQIAMLRDKLFFGIISDALNIRTPKNYSFFEKKNCYVFDTHKTISIEKYVMSTDVDAYMKLIDGECAEGVYKYVQREGRIYLNGKLTPIEDLYKITQNGRFVIQERVIQSDKISSLHPHAVNTVKISTVYDKVNDKIVLLPTFFRVGVGDMTVDNWAVGGLAIGVNNETGRLQEWAYYKPGYGTKVKSHPESGIVFKDFELPYFKEAIQMISKYHRLLPNIHSIGWDIAMLEDGPCIIEGNDNWEISPMQLVHGGMRKEFETLMKI